MSGFRSAACGLVLGAASFAQAEPVAAGDPYVPPALRQSAQRPSPSGAELDALVERKLRRSFDAADSAKTGRITREQAAAAGWGVVAQQFDRIDAKRSGSVSFDEIQGYLRAQAKR